MRLFRLRRPGGSSVLRLLPFLRPYWLRALEAGLCTAFSTALALPMPLLSIYVVDSVIANGQGQVGENNAYWTVKSGTVFEEQDLDDARGQTLYLDAASAVVAEITFWRKRDDEDENDE